MKFKLINPVLFGALWGVTNAFGIGIGEANVRSHLGEPLYALIDITTNHRKDINSSCLFVNVNEGFNSRVQQNEIKAIWNEKSSQVELTSVTSFTEPYAVLNIRISCKGLGTKGNNISKKINLLPDALFTDDLPDKQVAVPIESGVNRPIEMPSPFAFAIHDGSIDSGEIVSPESIQTDFHSLYKKPKVKKQIKVSQITALNEDFEYNHEWIFQQSLDEVLLNLPDSGVIYGKLKKIQPNKKQAESILPPDIQNVSPKKQQGQVVPAVVAKKKDTPALVILNGGEQALEDNRQSAILSVEHHLKNLTLEIELLKKKQELLQSTQPSKSEESVSYVQASIMGGLSFLLGIALSFSAYLTFLLKRKRNNDVDVVEFKKIETGEGKEEEKEDKWDRVEFESPEEGKKKKEQVLNAKVEQITEKEIKKEAEKLTELDITEKDVIEEAELYLIYGYPEKGIKALNEFILEAPEARKAWLRVASIYAGLGRMEEFNYTANEYYRLNIDKKNPKEKLVSIWNLIQALGRTLDPENPLYTNKHLMIKASKVQLGDILVSLGFVTKQVLDTHLKTFDFSIHGRLGNYLIDNKVITHAQLDIALFRQNTSGFDLNEIQKGLTKTDEVKKEEVNNSDAINNSFNEHFLAGLTVKKGASIPVLTDVVPVAAEIIFENEFHLESDQVVDFVSTHFSDLPSGKEKIVANEQVVDYHVDIIDFQSEKRTATKIDLVEPLVVKNEFIMPEINFDISYDIPAAPIKELTEYQNSDNIIKKANELPIITIDFSSLEK